MLEFENRLLIVEDMYIMPNSIRKIVRINENFYMIPSHVACGSISEDDLRPYRKTTNRAFLSKALSKYRCKSNHHFVLSGIMPRGGFNVSVKRAITKEELYSICTE